MADTGTELGVDLYDVLVVALDYLPSVSAEYTSVIGDYGAADFGAGAAMMGGEYFGGGSSGVVHASWIQANHAAAAFMTQTRTSLDETATALKGAVDLYWAADTEASRELTRQYNRHQPTPSD